MNFSKTSKYYLKSIIKNSPKRIKYIKQEAILAKKELNRREKIKNKYFPNLKKIEISGKEIFVAAQKSELIKVTKVKFYHNCFRLFYSIKIDNSRFKVFVGYMAYFVGNDQIYDSSRLEKLGLNKKLINKINITIVNYLMCYKHFQTRKMPDKIKKYLLLS